MAELEPVDVIPVNGWVLEMDGLRSPHFTQVQGLSKKTGTLEVVDGGTNRKYFFSDGILEHGPITLIRKRDGSADDPAFVQFFKHCAETGGKRDGTMIQWRHGSQVMKIKFTGLLMNELSLTDFDTGGGETASEISFVAQCDMWVIDLQKAALPEA